MRPQNHCLIRWNGSKPIHWSVAMIAFATKWTFFHFDSFCKCSFLLLSHEFPLFLQVVENFPFFGRGNANCEWQHKFFYESLNIEQTCFLFVYVVWSHCMLDGNMDRIFRYSNIARHHLKLIGLVVMYRFMQYDEKVNTTRQSMYHSLFHVLQIHEFKHPCAYVIEHIKCNENATKGRLHTCTVCLKWNWTNTMKNGMDSTM